MGAIIFLHMASEFIRKLLALDLEEKILNGGLVAILAGVISPWISGRASLIDKAESTFSGFGFHTSFIGLFVFCIAFYTLLITIVPLIGKNVMIRRQNNAIMRLITTSITTILMLAALSVLVKITLRSPGMEIRFGSYLALIGSVVATLYAYLEYRNEHKKTARAFFQHPGEEREEVINIEQ